MRLANKSVQQMIFLVQGVEGASCGFRESAKVIRYHFKNHPVNLDSEIGPLLSSELCGKACHLFCSHR